MSAEVYGSESQGRPRSGASSGGAGRAPWDREAERAVLGAVLLDARVLDEIVALISAKDFYLELHRQAFETDVTGGRADAETPGEEFIQRLTDLDNRPLWEAAAGRGAGCNRFA